MKFLFTFLLTGLVSFSFAQSPVSDKKIKEFDRYVEQVRQEWEVPGLAITVVKNGKVIFKKGYGVQELGKDEAVDTETLFACASTTKAMTVTVLGMLADEGKLSWDDPVQKYMPELKLYDPYVTRELKIRDLLLHRTGLGSTDFLSGAMDVSANEIFSKLEYVKPAYSFRSNYIYQNTMYAVAGRIIENITGKRWNEVMMERLFKPLGMKLTVPTRSLSQSTNMVKPHYPVQDEIKVLDYGRESEIGAAGGVWSNVDDMSLWVQCMLDSSKYAGGRLLKPETWTEIFRPQTMFPTSEYPHLTLLQPHWQTYSLGWYNIDYRGKLVNFHTGSLSGLTAIIGLLPEENLGVFIFGNYDHAEVRHALLYKAFDWFALGGNRDWSAELKNFYGNLKKESQNATHTFEAERVANTKTSLPLNQYAGTYSSPLYGTAEVSVSGDELTFNLNDHTIEATLPHWHFDTFYGNYAQFGRYKAIANFTLSTDGKVESLIMNGLEYSKK